MNILNSPQGYQPPPEYFMDLQQNPHNQMQKIQQTFGRGIVEGMDLSRDAVSGAVTVAVGYAYDNVGRLIVVDAPFVLDLSSISRPPSGHFLFAAVIAEYRAVEEGMIQNDIGEPLWKERRETISVRFTTGSAAANAGEADPPDVGENDVVLGDLLIDHDGSGCVSISQNRRTHIRQITELSNDYEDHKIDHGNPHQVTKAQVGLGNLPNWSGDTNPELGTSNTKIASQAAIKTYVDHFARIMRLPTQDIITSNKTTDLSEFWSTGSNPLPDGARIHLSWAGGNASYLHKIVVPTGVNLVNDFVDMPPGDGVNTFDWCGYGKGGLTLVKDEANSRWIVETEGLYSITTIGDLTERFYADGRIEIENNLEVSFNNNRAVQVTFSHKFIFGNRNISCYCTEPVTQGFVFYRIGNLTETTTEMRFVTVSYQNTTQTKNVRVKLEASWVAP